jgi:hypothetical protein
MRTTSLELASTSHITADAAAINEFFEDHFSRSDLILAEIEERSVIEKDQSFFNDEDLDDPEDWIHHLYARQVLARV